MPGALLSTLLCLSALSSTARAAVLLKGTGKRTVNIIVLVVIIIFVLLAIAGLALIIFLCRRQSAKKKNNLNSMVTVSTVQPYQSTTPGVYQRPTSVVVHQDGDWWQPSDPADSINNSTRRSAYLGHPNNSTNSRHSAHLGVPAEHRLSNYSTTNQSAHTSPLRNSTNLGVNATTIMGGTGPGGQRPMSTNTQSVPYTSPGPSRTSSYTQHAGGAVEANTIPQGTAQPFQIPAPNRPPAPPVITAPPPQPQQQQQYPPPPSAYHSSSASATGAGFPPAKPLQPQPTGTSIYSTNNPYELSAMTKSTSGHPGT